MFVTSCALMISLLKHMTYSLQLIPSEEGGVSLFESDAAASVVIGPLRFVTDLIGYLFSGGLDSVGAQQRLLQQRLQKLKTRRSVLLRCVMKYSSPEV